MKDAIAQLVQSYRSGTLSRRALAAGLGTATAAIAAPQISAASLGPPPRIRAQGTRTFLPTTTGGGADDTPAIQAAIDAASAAGGGQVLIEEHLSLGSRLLLKSGVELIGTGRVGSSLTALPGFPGASMVLIEAGSQHVALRGLTIDSQGDLHCVNILAGCKQIEIAGVRFTGWNPSEVGRIAIRISSAPSPTPTEEVVIDNCDFEQLAIGVKISEGASHISILRSRFRGIHRRCIWLIGIAGRSSRFIRVSGNTMLDFPLDPDHSNPIAIGSAGNKHHEYVLISNNVLIGNAASFGPMGGTGDLISLHCCRRSQVVGNAAIDSGDTGIVVVDSSDVIVFGNFVAGADAPGYTVKADEIRCRRIQFISNWAYNNGQNRDNSQLHAWVPCGFLMRDHAAGVVDTLYIGNYAWDDQNPKTQNYALSIPHETITSTKLTANVWRASQHAIDTIYNKGLRTEEAVYAQVPRV